MARVFLFTIQSFLASQPPHPHHSILMQFLAVAERLVIKQQLILLHSFAVLQKECVSDLEGNQTYSFKAESIKDKK